MFEPTMLTNTVPEVPGRREKPLYEPPLVVELTNTCQCVGQVLDCMTGSVPSFVCDAGGQPAAVPV